MAEMTFWDHLDELRKVLFRVIGIWFVLAIGYFIAMPYLFDHVILAPCHNDFIFYDLLRYIGQKFDLTDDFFTQDFHAKCQRVDHKIPQQNTDKEHECTYCQGFPYSFTFIGIKGRTNETPYFKKEIWYGSHYRQHKSR